MESESNKFSVLLDSARHRFDIIRDADDVIDQKSGTLIGFTTTIIIGYLTIISPQLTGIKLIEGIIGVAFFIVSTILLIIVNWPSNYSFASTKISSNQEYLNKEEKELLLQLISDNESAADKNYKKLQKKAILYKLAIYLLAFGSILLVLSKLPNFYV
jgi:uncharacterized ion transporter superfamily protein YfcC